MRQIKGCLQAEPCGYSAAVRKILLLVALAGMVEAQVASQTDSPRTRMEAQLETAVRAFKGQMGVAAIDVRTGETIAVNADIRFPTASTIKTAVMVEAWHQVGDGRLSMDTTLTLRRSREGWRIRRTARDARRLAADGRRSDPPDDRAQRQHRHQHADRAARHGARQRTTRRVRVEGNQDSFARRSATASPDVLPDLEREFGLGMTTPRDMARLMVLIADGKAVSAEASEAMLATLRRQQDRAMIPRLLPERRWRGDRQQDRHR